MGPHWALVGYPGGENSLLASEWHDVLKVGQDGLGGSTRQKRHF